IDAIAGIDETTLITQGLGSYPVEQFFMRGNVNAPILGLPVAEGELVADPAQGLFRLSAAVPEGTWLNDFVQGEIEFQIRSAEYILENDANQLPPGMTAEDLQPEARLLIVSNALAAALQPGATPADQQTALANAIARITDTLPKVSLEADLNLQVPPELSGFMQFNSGAGLFAYSPRFEPGYALPGYTGEIRFPDPDPNNPGPYTLARRNGGLVAIGSFTFGFNLTDPDPDKRLLIDIPEMALAMTGSPEPSLFPALNGRARVNTIALPGAFSFNGGPAQAFEFRNGLLAFNSGAEVGQDYLAIEGAMTPIDLGPFLNVRPLPADANPDDLLGGMLRVTRTAAGSSLNLSLDAAAVTVPMLGNLSGFIYGTNDVSGFTSFTFSTVPGQSWQATLELNGALEIHSPLDPTGPVLFRAEPMTDGAGQPIPFIAHVSGKGLESFEIRLTIPNGLVFTLFPGTDHESTLQTGGNSATCLFIASDGRIYFDSGTRTMDLNGLAAVTGRIELGFEPVDHAPVLSGRGVAPFSTELGDSQTQFVRVANSNPNGGQLVIDAGVSDGVNWSVEPSRVVLGPSRQAALKVRFTPMSAGAHNATLTLANNSANPLVTLPLTGTATVFPMLHVSVAAIDFGLTPLGGRRSQSVRVSNLGDATLTLSAISTAAPFSDDRATLSIPAGQSRDIVVSFTPTSTAAANGQLTFSSNDPDAPGVSVTLTGQGSNRFWYRQRRGTGLEHLTAIAMKSDDRGVAVGLRGALLKGLARGQMWGEDFLRDAPDLRAITFVNTSTGWIAGGSGRLYRTSNGGSTWIPQTDGALNGASFNWRAVTVRDRAAGLVAFAGEDNRRGRIVTETTPGRFSLGAVPKGTSPLSGIAFGTASVGLAVGENATVLKTTDGGKTWQPVVLPRHVSAEAHLRAVAVSDTSRANYIIVGDGGLILRTFDSGSTWTIRDSRTREDLYAVVRASNAFYAAGNNGTLRRSSSSGFSWFAESAETVADFRGMAALNGEVWAVSHDGDIFHRRTTPISGPVAVINAGDLDFGEIGVGERVTRELRIANEGTAPLTAELVSDNGRFPITPSGVQTVPPGGETLFVVRFEFGGAGVFGANIDVNTSDPATDKLSFQAIAANRKPDFTPLGYLLTPAQVNLGSVLAGSSHRVLVTVQNIGQARLNLHDLEVRQDTVAFDAGIKFNKGPFLDPGESGQVEVTFEAAAPGVYRGQLELLSDAANGVAVVELIAVAVAPSEVVVLDSEPSGATLTVDGSNVVTPAAFSIVDGAPGAGQLQRGATVTVQAPGSFTRDGVPYEFQRWDPGAGGTLTFVSGQSVERFTARYAPSQIAGAVSEPPVQTGQCRFIPPNDVAFGPWVKITEATLTLPWLGNGSGSEFEVEGALFLSLTRAYGSLTSSRIRVLVPSDAPAFADAELLEITPGSWRFDIQTGLFELAALSPGLQVLNGSTFPPTEFAFEVDLQTNAPNRRAFARFTTLDDLPLAPGLLAMGPSSVEFGVGLDPANPALRLALDGTLRALARPTGGWSVTRAYSLVVNPDLPALAPLTFTTRTQLADLRAVRLHADAGSQLGPVFDGNTFSLVANDLLLEFFRNGEYLRASASLGADGSFTFDADIPAGGVGAGPVRIAPHPSGNARINVVANPLQGVAAVALPRVYLNSAASPRLWADSTLDVPPSSFDSRDFTLRAPLPAIDLAGFDLDGPSSADADNYVEFKRTTTTTTLKFRNEQDLYLGAMKVKFKLSNNGSLSGQLTGRIGVDEPAPLDQVSDRVSLRYDNSATPEFVLNRFFFGAGCRLSFGSGLPSGQACVLTPNPDKPIGQWEKAVCLP
ncbi:MAG: choice-of-anchor D domain-containing protein, partial [Verrucomicrobia bacterium]